MAGNAHRSRPRSKRCTPDCVYCKNRPKFGLYKNKTGHRHNPTRKRSGRRRPSKIVQ